MPSANAHGAWRARGVGLLVCLLALVATSDARADEYLEPENGRSGFALGFGVGPGLFAGGGDYGELLGSGVFTTLRIGTSAGPRMLWLLQLDSVAYLAEDEVVDPPQEDRPTHTNIHSTLTVAMQYYLREGIWCKGGAGVASIAERQAKEDVEEGESRSQTISSGLGLMTSFGFDLYRRYSLALDVEAGLGLGIYSDGVIGQLGVRMALNWY